MESVNGFRLRFATLALPFAFFSATSEAKEPQPACADDYLTCHGHLPPVINPPDLTHGPAQEKDPMERAIDKLSDRTLLNLRRLYSAATGEGKDDEPGRDELFPLTPALYNVLLLTSLEREWQVSDILLSRKQQDRRFALLFGRSETRRPHVVRQGSQTSSYGIVVGEDFPLSAEGSTLGWHATFNQQSVKMKQPSGERGYLSNAGLGMQFGYQAAEGSGPKLASQWRISREQGEAERRQNALQHSDWSGWAATALLASGWDFPLTEGLSIGPIAGIQYTRLWRPAIDEMGERYAVLNIHSRQESSLRRWAGLEFNFRQTLNNQRDVTLQLAVKYQQNHVADLWRQRAAYQSMPGQRFEDTLDAGQMRATVVQAGVTLPLTEHVHVNLGVERAWQQGDNRRSSGWLIFGAEF